MRFYEFADLEIEEDLATALDARKKQLDNQKKAIGNRKKALANRKAQQANRDAVRQMASRHLDEK